MNRIHIFFSVCLACALGQAGELVRLSARDPGTLPAIAKGTNIAANASMEEGTTMPERWRWVGWNKANVTGKWDQGESHGANLLVAGEGYDKNALWDGKRQVIQYAKLPDAYFFTRSYLLLSGLILKIDSAEKPMVDGVR